MESVREDKKDSHINGFSEFSKPHFSGNLMNSNVPSSGFEGKNMFDSFDSESFYDRLSKLNESLGYNLVFDVRETKLNLHLLYKEVTLNGGFNQVCKDRRWNVIASSLKLDLNYPEILLKLYALFLYQYEQIYFYRGPEKVASMPDLTFDTEDNSRMEIKCTNHSSQMVTHGKDISGRKKMLNENSSQSMSTGSESEEKHSGSPAEQKQIPQLHYKKVEIRKLGSASADKEPAPPEKKKRKRGSTSAIKQREGREGDEKQIPAERKYMKKPGARKGVRSGYHIFIKKECDRIRNSEAKPWLNVRSRANDAWKQLSEIEKQIYIDLSIREKALAKTLLDADEQDDVMESADWEKQPFSQDGDYHVNLESVNKERESLATEVAAADEQKNAMESADLEKSSSPSGDYHVILETDDAERESLGTEVAVAVEQKEITISDKQSSPDGDLTGNHLSTQY